VGTAATAAAGPAASAASLPTAAAEGALPGVISSLAPRIRSDADAPDRMLTPGEGRYLLHGPGLAAHTKGLAAHGKDLAAHAKGLAAHAHGLAALAQTEVGTAGPRSLAVPPSQQTVPGAATLDVSASLQPTGPTHAVRPALVEAARHLKTEGGRTSLLIRLDPPELGAVLVRLTVKDGLVDVQLRTPDLAARGDLQAQQADVQQVLKEQGLDLSSFDVSHGETFTPQDPPPGGRQTPDRATPRQLVSADGHASTAHVMDDVPRPQSAGTWL
jgi:hypothetical protein